MPDLDALETYLMSRYRYQQESQNIKPDLVVIIAGSFSEYVNWCIEHDYDSDSGYIAIYVTHPDQLRGLPPDVPIQFIGTCIDQPYYKELRERIDAKGEHGSTSQ